MGLFDRFKKKNDQPQSQPAAPKAPQQPESTSPPSALYPFISRYNPYIVRFVGMQQQGNYAPISAYENTKGELIGHLYLGDEHYMLSAQEVVDRMKTGFEERLAKNEIRSYAILYHSQFAQDGNHALATSDEELKAISVVYNFNEGPDGAIALPYRFDDDGIAYTGFAELTQEENNRVFATQLEQEKDYFQERMNPQPEAVTNAAGLEIAVTNTKDNDNMWGGIFGFEALHEGKVRQMRMENAAVALMQEKVDAGNGITTNTLDAADVQLKVVSLNGRVQAMIPVIKTDYTIDVVNRSIVEWERNGKVAEALIKSQGRETFGVHYYATDYAENRELYQSKTKLDLQVSGIAFVLDLHTHENDGEMKFSENFTAYMPTSSLPDYGCFDFIGEIEELRETTAMEGLVNGYILKTRLITHDEPDFFTIDVFVNPENMRIKEVQKGMKVTGMLQLQGRIRK